MRAFGFHSVSLNGPLPTRLPARVQSVLRCAIRPNFSMVARCTGYHVLWAASDGRYGVGRSRVRRSVAASGAAMPTAEKSLIFPALNASAFLMDQSMYEYSEASSGVRMRWKE